MSNLFHKRETKARQQLTEESKGTLVNGNILVYKDVTSVYTSVTNEFPEIIIESKIPPKLNNSVKRVYNIFREMREANDILRYLANSCDDGFILAWVIFHGTSIDVFNTHGASAPEETFHIIDINKDRLKQLDKFLVKKDLYV